MDCCLVDILYPSEAFGGARIGNCDIKPTDGATIFAYLRTREISEIDQWVKLRKKGEKWNGIDGIWTPVCLVRVQNILNISSNCPQMRYFNFLKSRRRNHIIDNLQSKLHFI